LSLKGALATILFGLLVNLLVYSTTYYYSLDFLTEYHDSYGKEENQIFNNINLALKIMPNYNNQKNALYMEQSNKVILKVVMLK